MGQRPAESFHCSLIAEPALKEQAFGQFEGMTTIELLQNNPDAAEALFNLDAEYCPPEGESLSHASQRIMHFLTNLEKKRHHRTICIVSHGQVIQGVLAMLKSGAVDDFHRYAQPNASYSVFELINGRCTALKWGDRDAFTSPWIKQSDLPQIPAVHVCCSSSVCRSRRGSCLVAIACSGEYSKAGWNGFPRVQSRWHQGRLETALNTRAISNGRNGVQALSSA